MGAVRMRVQTDGKSASAVVYHIKIQFRAVLSCKRCLIWADFSPDSDQNTSSLEEELLWTRIWVKNILMLDLFQLLSSPDDNWWTVDYCDVFIRLSFWRHPFTAEHPLTLILTAPIHCRSPIDSHSDGTHSLQSIHCWDTFIQTWWRNKLISDDLKVNTFSARVHF